jgi:vacuolar-type H+-ATPase subunit I/STV1
LFINKVIKLDVVKKIKDLERSILAYQQIVTIKKSYLKQLQNFINYDNISYEFSIVFKSIRELEDQIKFMKEQVENLAKDRHE